MFKFREGERVRIKADAPIEDMREFSSEGERGQTYTIVDTDYNPFGDTRVYRLKGSNWHKEHWLERLIDHHSIGGEIV